ncbi:hypothetical protein AMTR_s00011p00093160 [Amborella trichopoda]|uniref:Uncharacterized protein n=1 Tax=Amborella trichopoda TaxID=13333 RepID=W1NFL9_AMBTC|nr:hypothetical protein AMTR_s00011p00093160 [Amborella trichopoda]
MDDEFGRHLVVDNLRWGCTIRGGKKKALTDPSPSPSPSPPFIRVVGPPQPLLEIPSLQTMRPSCLSHNTPCTFLTLPSLWTLPLHPSMSLPPS